jgi:hypothetical protein
MTPAGSMFGRKSEFDPFLGAPVGHEKNGMLISVVSALARLDMDPWREAAALTELPKKDAALRLTSLISSLPSDATVLLTHSTVNRLISIRKGLRTACAFDAYATRPDRQIFGSIAVTTLAGR